MESAEDFIEMPLQPLKDPVWCALRVCGIISLYFFEDDAAPNVTVNVERMITDFFVPQLNGFDVAESLVFVDKLQTLNHLQVNILHILADIRPQLLDKTHIMSK